MAKKIELYDDFANYYDLMVDWDSRLAGESAFLREVLETTNATRVLDLACGTGMHAILFARWGFEVVAADPSKKMLEIARKNAQAAGVSVDFIPVGFGELSKTIEQQFDVVYCLGNSLPHLLSDRELMDAARDVIAVLRPDGKLVAQNRNYDKVWAEKNRFMPLEAVEREGRDIVFFRFLDFAADLITFNIATMIRQADKSWSYTVSSTKHRPVFRDDLDRVLSGVGFHPVRFYGDLKGNSYIKDVSGDLVVVATKPV